MTFLTPVILDSTEGRWMRGNSLYLNKKTRYHDQLYCIAGHSPTKHVHTHESEHSIQCWENLFGDIVSSIETQCGCG